MSLSPQFGSIVPSQLQQTLANNYLTFDQGANDFAQQYLPEIYEQEVERYGNRTLSGFLRMVGAEMPMTSDQVIWSEQNRLHVAYDGCTVVATGAKNLFLIHIPEPTRQAESSYAVFCLKKKMYLSFASTQSRLGSLPFAYSHLPSHESNSILLFRFFLFQH